MLTPEQIKSIRDKAGVKESLPQQPRRSLIDTLNPEQAKVIEETSTYDEIVNKGKEFATGVAKGELKLAHGLGEVGAKLAGSVGFPVHDIYRPETEKYQKVTEGLESKTGFETAGEITANIASFLLPEHLIAKTMAKSPAIIRGTLQVAKDIGIAGLTKGDMGTTGILSVATRGAFPAIKLLSNVFQRSLGFLALRGTDVVDEIVKNPQYARMGLRGNPVDLLKKSATALSQYADDIKKGSSTTFGEGIKEIENNYDELLKGFKVVKPKTTGGLETITLRDGTTIIKDVAGNKFNLSLESVKAGLTKALKEFDVAGNTKTGFSFRNSALSNSEEKMVRSALAKLNNWDDITPTGLNRLADAIKAFAKPEQESAARANAVLFKLASNIDDYLSLRVPKFKELNSAFGNSQRFLEELSVHLNAVGKSTSPREISRISAKIQNLFGANKDAARSFLRTIPGGDKILGVEAGRELAIADITKASGAIGNIVANAIQTLIPPKAVGEIAAAFGTTKEIAEGIYNVLKPLDKAAKVTTINLLREAFDGLGKE